MRDEGYQLRLEGILLRCWFFLGYFGSRGFFPRVCLLQKSHELVRYWLPSSRRRAAARAPFPIDAGAVSRQFLLATIFGKRRNCCFGHSMACPTRTTRRAGSGNGGCLAWDGIGAHDAVKVLRLATTKVPWPPLKDGGGGGLQRVPVRGSRRSVGQRPVSPPLWRPRGLTVFPASRG